MKTTLIGTLIIVNDPSRFEEIVLERITQFEDQGCTVQVEYAIAFHPDGSTVQSALFRMME